MSLERLAAACVFPSFPGLVAPDWIRRFLDGGGGGIVLFAYNVGDREQLAALTASLRAGRPEVLVAIDEEGGDVTRVEVAEGSSTPGNAALGAIGDAALTRLVAGSIGSDLAALGVNWDLAPVADVNVPGNPVIGVRAFGSEAGLVAEHVAAFITGLQGHGVAACAKHFPGHGATEQDSHLELPTVTGDVAEGLGPFRAAIAAGVQTIMTAHVRVLALDDAPATLSRAVVQGLLRDELGFDGLVLADALEMKAVSATVGEEEGAVLALAAGVDALCVGHDLGEDAVGRITAAIVGAVGSGRLPETRLREAAERIRRVGEWTVAQRSPVEPSDPLLGLDAARRALLVEGDPALAGPAVVVELQPRANIAAGEHSHAFAGAAVVREGEPVPDADVFVVRDAHRHAWMREAADRPGAVVVEVGLPVWRPAQARGYVATYGRSRVSLEAAAERLGEAVPA
jgi:beta-N-acetylhexosaminidase